MADWSVRAGLTVLCESVSLEDVTKQVGVEPTTTIHKGSVRRPGARPARSPLWSYYKEVRDNGEPSKAIEDLLNALPSHTTFAWLQNKGTAWVSLDCRAYTTAPPFFFPAELLLRLGQAALSLDIDLIETSP